MNRARLRPCLYGLIYVFFSIFGEAALMIVFRLQPPRDNAILGPFVLTVPPLAAAWLFTRRGGAGRIARFMVLALLTVILTLLLTIAVNRLTGIKTGLLEPLIVRFLAGLLAWLTASFARSSLPQPGR